MAKEHGTGKPGEVAPVEMSQADLASIVPSPEDGGAEAAPGEPALGQLAPFGAPDAGFPPQDPAPVDFIENFEPIQPDLATGGPPPPAASAWSGFSVPDDPSSPQEPLASADSPGAAASSHMDQVRQYAERVPIGNPQVAAAFPFSVTITGPLSPAQQEKLIDVLNRESMGIREVDLRPQLEAGRVLIPRISEYAAVLLVHALRDVSADIQLAPSDSVYSTEDTRQETDLPPGFPTRAEIRVHESPPAAESLPITSLDSIPEMPHYLVIDIVTASAALTSRAVEAHRAPEYEDLLDALKRELKYKAYRKGATAILNFSVSLHQLTTPTHYRITVMGSAVRVAAADETPQPVT